MKLDKEFNDQQPNEGDLEIAFGLLQLQYFWDARGLRAEAQQLSNKISLKFEFEDVYALILYIHNKHVSDQAGEGPEALGLKIVG